jgi:glycosyltransferase involved in cell wall biosynthesis
VTAALRVLSIGLDDTLLQDRAVARGDAQDRMVRYADELDQLTYVVYARRAKRLEARRLAPNLQVIPTNSAVRWALPFDAWRLARRLARATRFDVVATQDPFTTGLVGLGVRWRGGPPVNVQVFTSFLENPGWNASGPLHRLLARVGQSVLRRADTVRVESATERDKVLRLGLAAERVWVIPLAVNVARFADADARGVRARLLGAGGAQLVLYVGRLAPEKDLGTLLRAMKIVSTRCDRARLAVVGEGPEGRFLRSLAQELGLAPTVTFVGAVGHEDLPQYYGACDIFTLSSIYEGIPTVLVEAALSGRPVVTTRTPNVNDVMEDRVTGLTVPIRSPEALAAAILELLEDPTRAAAMGRTGREFVRARYDFEKIYRDVVAMWAATAARR